jgi:hypothetical protein
MWCHRGIICKSCLSRIDSVSREQFVLSMKPQYKIGDHDASTTYDVTSIFCEQFAAFLKIGTCIPLKEEGDERKEVVGQILQVDLASTSTVSIFKPFEEILLKKDRTITNPPWFSSRRSYTCFPRSESRLVKSQTSPLFSLCRSSRNWELFCKA